MPIPTLSSSAIGKVANNATATSMSWSHTVNPGDTYLVVAFALAGTMSSPAVTFNGEAMSHLLSNETAAPVTSAAMYEMRNPPVGTFTVQCSWGAARGGVGVSASLIDVNAAVPWLAGDGNTEIGTTSPMSCAVPTLATSLVVDMECSRNGAATTIPTITQDGSQTNINTQTWTHTGNTDALRIRMTHKDGTGGTVTMQATVANFSSWVHGALAIRGLSGNSQPAMLLGF